MTINAEPYRPRLQQHSHSRTALIETEIGAATVEMPLPPASQKNVPDYEDVETTPESTSPWDVIIKRELTVKSSSRGTKSEVPSTSRALPKPPDVGRDYTKIKQLTGSDLAFGSTPSLTVLGRQRPKSVVSSRSSGSVYSQNEGGQEYEQNDRCSVNWDVESSTESSFSHLQDAVLQKPIPNMTALWPREQYQTSAELEKKTSKRVWKSALDEDELLLRELLALERERYEYEYRSKSNTQEKYSHNVIGIHNLIPQPLNLPDRTEGKGVALDSRRLGTLYLPNPANSMPYNSVSNTPVSPVGAMESDYLLLPPMLLPEVAEQNLDRCGFNDLECAPRCSQLNPTHQRRLLGFKASDTRRRFRNRSSGSSSEISSPISTLESNYVPPPPLPAQNRNRYAGSDGRTYLPHQLESAFQSRPASSITQNSSHSLSKRLSGMLCKLSIDHLKKAISLPNFPGTETYTPRKSPPSEYVHEAITRAKQKLHVFSGDERRRMDLKKKIVVVSRGDSPERNSGSWV